MKTKKMFYNLILCILTDIVKQDKQTFISFAKIKIKAVIYYIKAIRFIRLICIGILVLNIYNLRITILDLKIVIQKS